MTSDLGADANRDTTTANSIVDVLSSLVQMRSNRYYISNFDPSLHEFDAWCSEVDRGREINRWDDRECLSRVANFLRGDSRTWLNDWVCNDRTWTNFKVEFRALCPRNIDTATILFETMKTDSNNFQTFSDYARKTLLRLNFVKGLSDDLKSSIVIRGITDPSIKAAAVNAKLQPKDLVEFLSVYTKSNTYPF